MENEAASRRIQQIACHLMAKKEAGGDILFPMRCNGTMNSVIKRCDNMVLFARQGTASQGYFMRQVTIQQFPDYDVGAASQLDAPLECTNELSSTRDKKNFASNASQDPMFSKPVEFQQGSAASLDVPQQQLQNMLSAAARSPLFAKPISGSTKGGEKGHLTGRQLMNKSSGIRVEVDDKRLLVTGKRSTDWWKDGNGKYAVYHKRELLEGPYRVVWELPANSNRDAVSAEFVDGLLQIRIPKKDQ